jgi:hypothetical protein
MVDFFEVLRTRTYSVAIGRVPLTADWRQVRDDKGFFRDFCCQLEGTVQVLRLHALRPQDRAVSSES